MKTHIILITQTASYFLDDGKEVYIKIDGKGDWKGDKEGGGWKGD